MFTMFCSSCEANLSSNWPYFHKHKAVSLLPNLICVFTFGLTSSLLPLWLNSLLMIYFIINLKISKEFRRLCQI